MASTKQLAQFIDALHDHVQEPGWFMMKPANPGYAKAQRISTFFVEHRDDIEALCKRYLESDGAIKKDCDLCVREIITSAAWQSEVTQYIATIGHYAGDAAVLLGEGL